MYFCGFACFVTQWHVLLWICLINSPSYERRVHKKIKRCYLRVACMYSFTKRITTYFSHYFMIPICLLLNDSILTYIFCLGFYQLKIFKNDSEKVLKTAYTLTKDSYVGTERGAIQSKKRSETSTPYWAVILNNDSVVFQEIDGGYRNSGVDLKDWDLALKEYLPSGELWNKQTNKVKVPDDDRFTLHNRTVFFHPGFSLILVIVLLSFYIELSKPCLQKCAF